MSGKTPSLAIPLPSEQASSADWWAREGTLLAGFVHPFFKNTVLPTTQFDGAVPPEKITREVISFILNPNNDAAFRALTFAQLAYCIKTIPNTSSDLNLFATSVPADQAARFRLFLHPKLGASLDSFAQKAAAQFSDAIVQVCLNGLTKNECSIGADLLGLMIVSQEHCRTTEKLDGRKETIQKAAVATLLGGLDAFWGQDTANKNTFRFSYEQADMMMHRPSRFLDGVRIAVGNMIEFGKGRFANLGLACASDDEKNAVGILNLTDGLIPIGIGSKALPIFQFAMPFSMSVMKHLEKPACDPVTANFIMGVLGARRNNDDYLNTIARPPYEIFSDSRVQFTRELKAVSLQM